MNAHPAIVALQGKVLPRSAHLHGYSNICLVLQYRCRRYLSSLYRRSLFFQIDVSLKPDWVSGKCRRLAFNVVEKWKETPTLNRLQLSRPNIAQALIKIISSARPVRQRCNERRHGSFDLSFRMVLQTTGQQNAVAALFPFFSLPSYILPSLPFSSMVLLQRDVPKAAILAPEGATRTYFLILSPELPNTRLASPLSPSRVPSI